MLTGALDMQHKTAYVGMTPLARVTMLSTLDPLDHATLRRALRSGHSRLPVYAGRDRCALC